MRIKLSLERSERIYVSLLSLYPVGFRVRFAHEMAQVFRDCNHDVIKKDDASLLAAFWFRTARDLFLSVIRERRRELLSPLAPDHPVVGVLDLLLIPSMVSANLIALGPILALLVNGGVNVPTEQFVVTSGFFSFGIGSLAIVASLVMAKLRPTVRLWVKLSSR